MVKSAAIVTTVPPQALGFLNSKFMNDQATVFAERLRKEAGEERKRAGDGHPVVREVLDRNAALAQYKLCRQILREELGIRPMDSTRDLFKQILHEPGKPAGWPSPGENQAVEVLSDSETVHSMAETALQKLQRLQQLMAETNLELQQIERLISKTLWNTKQ